jgi:hypothetical protein
MTVMTVETTAVGGWLPDLGVGEDGAAVVAQEGRVPEAHQPQDHLLWGRVVLGGVVTSSAPLGGARRGVVW